MVSVFTPGHVLYFSFIHKKNKASKSSEELRLLRAQGRPRLHGGCVASLDYSKILSQKQKKITFRVTNPRKHLLRHGLTM